MTDEGRNGRAALVGEAVRWADRGMGLAFWAQVHPDAPALCTAAGSRTFGELNEHANAVARGLAARGLRSGDGVALVCSNRAEFAEVVAAADRTGLRLIPVNWHLTAQEIRYIVTDSDSRGVIADARFADLVSDLPAAATVRFAVGGDITGFDPYDDVLEEQDGGDIEAPIRGTVMLYTSGTTGHPKGVYRRNPTPPRAANIAIYGYAEGDTHLCTGPLYHAAPLAFSLLVPLLAGVQVSLMDGWNAASCLGMLQSHKVTHTHMVPTMFNRLLALPERERADADLSALRFLIHGAAPCPVHVKQAMLDWVGPILWEYYAATEGVGTLCDPLTWLASPGTVGGAVSAGGIVVGDDPAHPFPAGSVGTIWLRGDGDARFEYWGDAGKTAASYRGDYFTLGDIGYITEEGLLFVTDRTADVVISGGVNVYPAEIDGVLLGHPAIADAGCVGVPCPEWGEDVVAVVEVCPDAQPDSDLEAEIIAWCRDRLAHFKCPRRVVFVDRLPRTESGKLPRRLLRDLAGVIEPAQSAPETPNVVA